MNQRRQSISEQEFYFKYGYGWDYCLVFNSNVFFRRSSLTTINEDEEKDRERDGSIFQQIGTSFKKSLKRVQKGSIDKVEGGKQNEVSYKSFVKDIKSTGLEVKVFKSAKKTKDEKERNIFCMVRAPLEVLRHYASDTGRRIELDPDATRARAEEGYDLSTHDSHSSNGKVHGFQLNDEPEFSKYHPYSHIFAPYRHCETVESLYRCSAGMSHSFMGVVRLELVRNLLREEKSKGGAGINLEEELHKNKTEKILKAEFPLHHEKVKDKLKEEWLVWWQLPMSQPFYDIKDYFGEKIGLYFKFLGHYTQWMFILALFGCGTSFLVGVHHSRSDPSVIVFSLIVAVWAVAWLEDWKRMEAKTALEWGTTGIEEEEQVRPAFQGEEIDSPINGEKTKYWPKDQYFRARIISAVTITISILVVLIVVIAIFGFRFWMVNMRDWTYGSTIGSGLNSAQITVANIIYSKIAEKYTKLENHRTDTSFEDALIGKLFLFQFVNSYSSFFYIAFSAAVVHGECEGGVDCMKLLHKQLAIIFLVNVVVGNLKEVCTPILKLWWKEFEFLKGRKIREKLGQAEHEFNLEDYDVMMGPLLDYEELAIQFGYMTLFVTAWPMLPLFGLVSNLVEIKSDAYKLLNSVRRPIPTQAQDIGTWYVVFKGVATISVITNAALCVFVMKSDIHALPIELKIWMFLLIQFVIFGLSTVIRFLVPDVPADVEMQLQRQNFLIKKLIHQIPDEDDTVTFKPEEIDDIPIHDNDEHV